MFSNLLHRWQTLSVVTATFAQSALAEPEYSLPSKPAQSVSIKDLTATPGKYKGRQVKVRGYLIHPSKKSKEQAFLCAAKATGEGCARGGSVGLLFTGASLKQLSANFRKEHYVVVEGFVEEFPNKGISGSRVRVCKIERGQEVEESAKIPSSAYGANYKPDPSNTTHVGDFSSRR